MLLASRRTATWLAVATTAVAAFVLGLGGPSPAGAAPSSAALTADCSFAGTEIFTPPLTLTGRPTRATVAATGRCSGTLVRENGSLRTLRAAPARFTQDVSAASASCVDALLSGSGTIVVDGESLPFTVSETQVTAVAAMQVTAPSWQAAGVAYLTPTADLPATALSCLSSGVARIPVTVSLKSTKATKATKATGSTGSAGSAGSLIPTTESSAQRAVGAGA